ncbi:MAG: deoxyribonuclease IV [Myxococcaceae bacterium]
MIIGAHESIAGGPSKAFARAEEHGARSLQIFTRSARGWTAPPLLDEECRAFRAEAARCGLPVVAHGSYLANLATEEPVLRGRSIACVLDELTRCERLGVPYLVIHPGSHPDEAKGIAQIAAGLDQVHAQTPKFKAKICLENTAGQGTSIGWRFEHLAAILEAVKKEARLGCCLDTCHLFAAGYDFVSRGGYEKALAEFDRVVGLSRVACFHLNDCKKPLGCRVDRHEEIGEGTIGRAGFKPLVNDRRFAKVVGVLETPTPERYGEGIRLLSSLVKA